MKRFLKLTLLAGALLLCGSTLSAQQKFGFINMGELITAMPERAKAIEDLQALDKELQELIEAIQVEFNTKLMDYQKNLETMTESARQLREKELQDIQARHEAFQQQAQEDFNRKSQELMAPIMAKAQEAIGKVSKAQNLIMVFDLSASVLVYHDTSTMVDVLPLAKRELGI